jgi:hypothetical protein
MASADENNDTHRQVQEFLRKFGLAPECGPMLQAVDVRFPKEMGAGARMWYDVYKIEHMNLMMNDSD